MDAATGEVTVELLGPIRAERAGRPIDLGSPKQRAVFAMLALRASERIDRDVLVMGVWGDDAGAGRVASLHTYVSNLRSVLGGLVEREHRGYRLALGPDAIDALRFSRAVDEARASLIPDPSETAKRLRDALAWWRGRPLADLDDIPGLQPDIHRLEQLRLDAVELRIEADLLIGHHAALVAELAALASEHPLRERFRAQQMVALYRCGQQVEALRAYRESVRYLDDELGLAPSPELQQLELAILGHDDELLSGLRQPTTQRLAVLVVEVDVPDGAWDTMPQNVGEALAEHDETHADAVAVHGGRLARSSSGVTVAVFPGVVGAAAAAEQVVRSSGRDNRARGLVCARIGIDVGEVEVGGSTVKGPPVTRAYRLCAVANAGQALLSSAACRDLAADNPAGVQIRMLGEHELFGFPAPERVGQLVVEGFRADFPHLRPDIGERLDHSIAKEIPGYELRGRLGEASFGSVWRAYQPSVGREVTVKVIPPEFAEHPAFARYFEVEARAIARLARPHILPIIDFWRNSDGAFLVRQHVQGHSLSQIDPGDGDARRIVRQLAGALDHAHAHGVVHGDVRPENVLIDRAGNAYLTDFGIAVRHLESQIDAQAVAPSYRAPEETVAGPTAAGDRYSLGMLARALVVDDEASEPVLARATAAAADDRHPTASAFVVELEHALGDTAEGDARPSARASLSAIRNPYKGLRAFDEADGADFHGRDDFVAELVAAVAAERFVTVVGASGSGKSSLVRAGLLPALRAGVIAGSDSWDHAVVTPGVEPATSVHEALTSCTGDVVIVIDQFEELYTLVDSDKTRQRFIDLLTGLLDDTDRVVRVVATLRADFYDRPLSDARLARIITRAVITVLPPDPEHLRAMITVPAHAVGLRWEPGLANRVARDVESAPGALPLLQFALTELVERRHSELLTTTDYERIGGVTDAVGRRAEAVYGGLGIAGRAAARTILLRLVTVDDDGVGEARRRVRRSELNTLGLAGHEVDVVLDAFVSERLLLADRDPVTRGPTVEVAHEALLRAWPRLRDWIDVERGALAIAHRFRSAQTEWESADRNPEYLIRGSRLAVFDDWATAATMSDREREFLDACSTAESTVHRARRRRRHTIVALLATIAIVASALGAVAVVQARRADHQAKVAKARALTSAAVAALDTDPELAVLLAIAAADTAEPTVDTISVLRRAASADRLSSRHAWPESIDHMVATALSPDGTLAAYAGPSVADPDIDRLEVRDVETWSMLWSNETRSYGVDGIWFSPDSTRLITGLSTWTDDEVPRGVRVFDARSGQIEATHELGRCGATVSDVTARAAIVQVWPPIDGSCTWEGAEVDPPSSLELVDLVDGDVTVIEPEILDAAPKLDDDGRLATFAVDEGGPRIVVMELATGRRILEVGPDEIGIYGGLPRELSPDGSMLVAGNDPLVVIDVASGRIMSRFDEHRAPPHSVMWTPGGSSVWSVAADGSMFEWDPFDASVITDLPAQGGSGDLRVSRRGMTVLVDDLNSRSMSVLEPRGSGELWRADVCDDGGQSRDGSLTVAAGVAVAAFECVDGFHTAQIDDAGSMTMVLPAPATGDLAIHPAGVVLARRETRADADSIVLRDTGSGDVDAELVGSSGVDSRWIEFSPDGRIVLAVGGGEVHAWDATSGAMLGSIDVCGFISDVAFRPDEAEVVIGCFEEPLAVVSSATWSIEARPEPAVGHYPTFPGYSADGTTLLVLNGGTGATSMMWLDAETFEVIDRLDDVHVGAPTAWTMSPSGALAATASSDGFVKVWDVGEARQVDELYFEGGASGVAFASEDELLVATDRGVGASTLDRSEYLRTARSSTTRDFTRAECDRYDIGAACRSDEEPEPGVSGVAP